MVFVWSLSDLFGLCLVFVWSLFGLCTICLVFVWFLYGLCVEIGNLLQSCLRLQQFLHFRIMYAELFVVTGLPLCLH